MSLELTLTKEEIPILYETGFHVPIHPKLLDPSREFDPSIAQRVFPDAAQDWYSDLQKYAHTLTDDSQKKWIHNVFLRGKPEIRKEYGSQTFDDGVWRDDIQAAPNGFVSSLSINRNAGGTLYVVEGDRGCQVFVSFEGENTLRLSKEKAKEFAIKEYDDEKLSGCVVRAYSQHNVDNYPGALFLRNWAIKYMNEVLKQVAE